MSRSSDRKHLRSPTFTGSTKDPETFVNKEGDHQITEGQRLVMIFSKKDALHNERRTGHRNVVCYSIPREVLRKGRSMERGSRSRYEGCKSDFAGSGDLTRGWALLRQSLAVNVM